MKAKRIGNVLVVRVDRGEELVEGITRACKEENVRLGTVSGIGAADDVTIGAYSVKTKAYTPHHLTGQEMELTSVTGNVTMMEEKVYLHLHATVADEQGHVHGGHLNEAMISATSEIFIHVYNGSLDRVREEQVGLNLLDL